MKYFDTGLASAYDWYDDPSRELLQQTIFTLVANDIDAEPTKNTAPRDKEELLQFLESFFHKSVCDVVSDTLDQLSNEGLERHAFRFSQGQIAMDVLSDVTAKYVTTLTSSSNSSGEEEWKIIGGKKGRAPVTSHLDRSSHGNFFKDARRIPIETFAEETPKRKNILEKRSLQFSDSKGHHYDPHSSEGDKVTLFHGTRARKFESFEKGGVSATPRKNEFSCSNGFYTTNYIETAYQQPLFQHLSIGIDPVYVLRFDLKRSVLHGEMPPPGRSEPFDICWFEDAHDEWNQFCSDNLYENELGTESPYDIVIGPMCYPDSDSKTLVGRNNPEGLVQVAFTSKAAMDWCGCNIALIYEEKQIP